MQEEKYKQEKPYKPRKEWNWKVNIEYADFPSEARKRLSYELFAESLANQYRNKQKFLQEECKYKEKIAD